MSDCKSQLLMELTNAIVKVTDADTASIIRDIIIARLSDYDVERKVTALAKVDADTNENIINSFMASLIIEGKSKGTAFQYKRSIHKLLDFTGKNCTEIDANDVKAWLAKMKLRGLKNTSVSNQKNNVSSFFRWMRIEHIRVDNPCEAVGTIKIPKEQKKAFLPEDIDTIRSMCNVRERAIVETLLSSGVRIAELCNLKVSDIDFANLTVFVEKGKGNKDRTVFITPVCKKHLLAYLDSKKVQSIYLFSKSNATKYTPGGISRTLRKMAKKSGIHIHPHRFRRTLATECAKKGMPIQEIQVLLGHSDIATTRRYIDIELTQVQSSYRQLVA